MCSPSPPPAPDYAAAAKEQGEANVDAARVSARLNNPNVVNPYGTQTTTFGGTFDQTGYDQAMQAYKNALGQYQSDMSAYQNREDAGQPYSGIAQPIAPERKSFQSGDTDIPTLTQTFSPEQQKLYEQSTKVKDLLGMLGIQGAESLQGVIGKNLDFSGMPTAPGSAEDTRRKVIDSMMSRVNEDLGQREESVNSDLIARGIVPGTKAYEREMTRIDRTRTDALQQAQLAAGQEASRDFGLDTQRRKDAIAELLSQRQVPLNEINALMSGSQVTNPFAVPGYAANAQVAPAPVYGAAQAAGQYGTDVYNAGVGSQNALMGGLFGLGSAGIGAYGAMNAAPLLAASDRRLKSNIHRIATHPLGIGIYEYDIAGRHEIGVMAQEVLEVKPEAVVAMPNGFYAVNYGAL